jgi:hypothetical protein
LLDRRLSRRARPDSAIVILCVVAAGCSAGAAHVGVPTAAPSATTACRRLISALPDQLDAPHGNLHRRETEPTSARTAAYGDPPVVLRCGVARPPGYQPGGQTVGVNGVTWFQRIGSHRVTWTAVGRPVRVQLRVPKSYESQGGFLVQVGSVVKRVVPAGPIGTVSPPSK